MDLNGLQLPTKLQVPTMNFQLKKPTGSRNKPEQEQNIFLSRKQEEIIFLSRKQEHPKNEFRQLKSKKQEADK